jgi:hypothetical protein
MVPGFWNAVTALSPQSLTLELAQAMNPTTWKRLELPFDDSEAASEPVPKRDAFC